MTECSHGEQAAITGSGRRHFRVLLQRGAVIDMRESAAAGDPRRAPTLAASQRFRDGTS